MMIIHSIILQTCLPILPNLPISSLITPIVGILYTLLIFFVNLSYIFPWHAHKDNEYEVSYWGILYKMILKISIK
jgi:hypothetical protein